jgi:type IV secretion system protein TrbI
MSEVYQRTTEPTGTLPKIARSLFLTGIALLMLVALYISSRFGDRGDEPKAASAPSSAVDPSKLKAFEAMIRRQGSEGYVKRPPVESPAGSDRVRDAHLQRLRGPAVRPERDPLDELERKRRLLAPYAPSTVITVKEPETKAGEPQPQVVYRASDDPVRPDPDRGGKQETGSGVFLPEREGSLYRLYEGTLVRTVLLNRLNGTFTGPVKCVVSEPVLARDQTVLIPKGSVFLGEAQRVEERNQRRLAVLFDRLLLPNGYSVPLEDTPGLNRDGDTGLKDKANNHFVQRFSVAGAIGLLGGLALYGGRGPWGYGSGVTAALGNVATNDLSRRTSDVPDITIREGHIVDVYLSNDLLVPAYVAQKGTDQ